jgi:hypothetical protein
MFDSPGAGFMEIQSQKRPQFRDYNHRPLYRKFETPFFPDGSNIADPARCQSHLCLVKIAVLKALLIKPSRTFKEMSSYATALVHIRPPFPFQLISGMGLNEAHISISATVYAQCYVPNPVPTIKNRKFGNDYSRMFANAMLSKPHPW